MEKQDLTESLRVLKQWINDPANSKNYAERREVLNKIALIKQELRKLSRQENVDEYKTQRVVVDPNVKIETVIVEENFTAKHIDTYRYHSLLKKMNDKYIADNCKLQIGDLVKAGDKEGFIQSFNVYPDKVKRKVTGIYAQLVQRKIDGTAAIKTLRRSRLDNLGFPIEELVPIVAK